MRYDRSAWVVAAVGAAVVSTSVVNSLWGQQGRQVSPARAAVVDVRKAVNNLEEKAEAKADIERMAQELKKNKQKRQQAIKNLQQDLKVLSPESDAYKRTKTELQQKMIKYKTWRKFKKQQLDSEKVLRMEALYRKVIDAVEQVAKSSGYDLVLYKDRLEATSAQSQKELGARIRLRKVLYAEERLDITDRVIQVVNNRFNAEK